MQEQNFEKQVRDKMDELSFVPSAPVWEKVEEQIRKKKEKRRVIFWLMPLLIMTGLGWWLVGKKATEQQPEIIRGTESPLPERPLSPKAIITEKQPGFKQTENTITQLPNNNFTPKTRATLQQSQDMLTGPIDLSSSAPIAISEQKLPKAVSLPILDRIYQSLDTDSILNSKSLIKKDIPRLKTDSINEVKPTVQNKWQLAFAAQGGASGISEGFGSWRGSANMDYYAVPNTSSGGTSGSGNFGNIPSGPSSTPKSGFAFSAGLEVKRKLNNRLNVVSGLRFAYYSNSIQVGSPVHRDTSISRMDASVLRTEAFYRNDANKHHYINQYHFIQIPLSIEYKLSASLPLYMQGGIKLERLLWSNALFYNQYAGVYVKDKDMLAKTGMQVFSGLSYHFRSKKAFSFAVGPQLQYGVTNVTKNKSNDQHLYFVGISTQIFLKNK